MDKCIILSLLIIALVLGVSFGLTFYWQDLQGILPSLKQPPADITKILNTTGMPLKLPVGFSISIFADKIPGARVMIFDSTGNLWVSQTSQGRISRLEIKDGKILNQKIILNGLNGPHGLAFDPENPSILYFAEEDKISKIDVSTNGKSKRIADLPEGGGHSTRTLGFGPDLRLYVSIGSSCNVCVEQDERRAAIYSMKKDGTDFKKFSRGLRNAVFFTWNPADKKMWATEMGRDLLGDDIPPDEINIIQEDNNYGWPICYGKNIHDDSFDKNVYIRNPCLEPFETPSFIDIPAHSAPLGLAFIPGNGWPEDYANDLLVSYHGSWNRSEPTGYKIVRHKFNEKGDYLGVEDFVSGWLTPEGALGRPVDINIQSDGTMYVSDDKAGVIYKIIYATQNKF